MQSFRTELENPVVERDIIDLEKKIRLYRGGQLDEDKFKSLRLARGVYGQRQSGVQMVRIKIPFGRMTAQQLIRVADISDEYSNGNLHATTRQDIQIHYVSLERTPELWSRLEQDKLTLREACGNTVRNVTGSAKAGVDPNEAFDVSPYAYETFQYFLRNPICQEMGRKFKIAFSSSENDSAFTFIHDIGAIPKIKNIDGEERRGFKVMIGGGLGAQPHMAEVAFEFLEEELLIPFIESVLRVFDRYGERNKRGKARMKFLMSQIGKDELLRLASEEHTALQSKVYWVDRNIIPEIGPKPEKELTDIQITKNEKYEHWLNTNVFEQKQKGFYAAFLKLPLGNLNSNDARKLAEIVNEFAADDIRVTVNQGYLLRFIRKEALPHLFVALDELHLAEPGFDSTADITACPGTDTCNLGISNSTGVSLILEDVIRNEFPDLIYNNDIKIKISGCPNSCGQHGIASIGFHGSSLRDKNKLVVPAVQVLLGGGVDGDGNGRIAEKVVKVPSKRAPQTLRVLLEDFDHFKNEGEYFADYYQRQGKMYFYHLLKPIADTTTLDESDYQDWGHEEEEFKVEAGVGECAGVVIDLVATLVFETEEKFGWANEAFEKGAYADAIYHGYNTFISGAKALLLTKDVNSNTHIHIMSEFDKNFVEAGQVSFEEGGFTEHVLRMKKNEPTEEFATEYLQSASNFLQTVKKLREQDLQSSSVA